MSGVLVQINGSQHSWLEGRGPTLTLLVAADDATGTLAEAALRAGENNRGYPVLLESLVLQRGSSSATTPPCLHCRLEIPAKGVVHAVGQAVGRTPRREAALMKGGCYQAVFTRAGRFPSVSSAAADASGSG